jgi:2,3-bisphosphoglycerate-independent phosphoglycerate mutase
MRLSDAILLRWTRTFVLDRRAGRITNDDAAELASSLQRVKLEKPSKAKFLYKSTIQHRAALVFRAPRQSTSVGDPDPEETGKKIPEKKPLDNSDEAKLTVKITNKHAREFHKVLRSQSINKERTEHARIRFDVDTHELAWQD